LKKFFSNEKFYITDFVYQNNMFWILGYADKSILKQEIAVINTEGKIVARSPAPIKGNILNLFLDAYGNVHARSRNTVEQLFISDKSIISLYIFEKEAVGDDLERLRTFFGPYAIFREESGESNCHDYIAVDTSSFEVDTLISLYNDLCFDGPHSAREYEHPAIPGVGGRWWLSNIDSLIAHGSDPREHLTFDPSDEFTAAVMDRMDRSPIGTNVYTIDNRLLFSTDRKPCVHIIESNMDITKQIRFDELFRKDELDLFQDPITKELYWVWLENGIINISRLSQDNWQVSEPYTVPGLPYPDKLLIINSRCYFIHHVALNNGFSNFYSYDLPFKQ